MNRKSQIAFYLFILLLVNIPCANMPAIGFQPDLPTNLNPDKIKVGGDFNGDGKKETIQYQMRYDDPLCYCNIYFSTKKIEPLISSGNFVSYIRNEGELDAFPGDEFTVYWGSCEASEWLSGVVYSIRNGKWKTLAAFSVYGSPSLYDYVDKDPNEPNTFLVQENYWKGDSMSVRTKKIHPD